MAVVAAIACSGSTSSPTDARAAAPTFSPVAGTYASPRTVTISSATEGAIIHCTQDGSTPTAASATCADPVTVSATTTIVAIATAAGFTPSDVATATYTIGSSGQAATAPAFSPAAGTYASPQTVTISSATEGGAVIHCTRDGSTPTAASPTCAEPFVVSSTTTIRAIATAAGYLPSPVTSATYTINVATTEKLLTFSTKRLWFAHQSVGDNVYHGADGNDASGLALIVAQNPASGCSMGDLYLPDRDDLAAIPPGRWADSLAGASNGDPVGKLNAFSASLGSDFGGGLDYAGLKFCFSDADTQELAESAWTRYQQVMDPLEAKFPGRLIYWTVPLTTYEGANVHREWLSNQIRTKYGSTGRVFDIADYESRDAAGELVLGSNGYRTLNPAWDAADHSHLDATGANHIAQQYLGFMYEVQVSAATNLRSMELSRDATTVAPIP